jgi:carbon storage regulator
MLVLTRRNGESIVLPQTGATIKVIQAKNRSVRLGITAPSHVAVHREELWSQIKPPNGFKRLGDRTRAIRVLVVATTEAANTPYASLTVSPRLDVRFCNADRARRATAQPWKPDLILLDAHVRPSSAYTLLSSLGGMIGLPHPPVLVRGEEARSLADALPFPNVDCLSEDVTSEQLEDGICALFAYREWRRSLSQTEVLDAGSFPVYIR